MAGWKNVGTQPLLGARARYENITKCMQIAARMHEKGWPVDRDKVALHVEQSTARAAKYSDLFLRLTGLPPGALGKKGSGQTDAVKSWFWDTAQAPKVAFDRITKRPQFNTATLNEYATLHRKAVYGPAAAALWGLRSNIKTLQFLRSYEAMSRADGRIHVDFIVSGAKTGRWSASARLELNDEHYRVNIQQVSQKEPSFDFGAGPEKLVSSLRDVWVAEPGCVVISADYDALEGRLIAANYGVQAIIDELNNPKGDIHSKNARAMFAGAGIDPTWTKADKAMRPYRDAAKSLMYGFSYQYTSEVDVEAVGDDFAYRQQLDQLKKTFPGMTQRAVNELAKNFFELYPEILAGHAKVSQEIRENGYFELPSSGRRLYYPSTYRGFNQALNFMQQGAGAVLMDQALIQFDKICDWSKVYPLAQVHDELVCMAPVNQADEVMSKVKACMETPITINGSTYSMPAVPKAGQSWGDCK